MNRNDGVISFIVAVAAVCGFLAYIAWDSNNTAAHPPSCDTYKDAPIGRIPVRCASYYHLTGEVKR